MVMVEHQTNVVVYMYLLLKNDTLSKLITLGLKIAGNTLLY